jgi:hypothetical protein
MRLVIIESPYAGDTDKNIDYARKCMVDSLLRGEAPFASHLLYTQNGVLNDRIPGERLLGIKAGLAWGSYADVTAVYTDLGISEGMELGIRNAISNGRDVVYRTIL